jgi:hypothetical protein
MSDTDVLEAVLYVAENEPIPGDNGVKVGTGRVASRLVEAHGYTDEEGAGLSEQMASTFDRWVGKLWTYHTTDQDGVPGTVFVPDAALEDIRERVEG